MTDISGTGVVYKFDGQSGNVMFWFDGELIYEFSTNPSVKVKGEEVVLAGGEIIDIKNTGPERNVITYRDQYLTKTAYIDCTGGFLRYSCTISSEKELRIDEIIYGGNKLRHLDSENLTTGEMFCWSPDINRTLLPRNGRVSVGLSSYEIRDMSFIKGDGGRFIIPPYVAGIRTGNIWLGMGTTEIPGARQGLQPVIENRVLSLKFEYNGALTCNQSTSVKAPEVLVYTAVGTEEVISKYTDYLFKNSLAVYPKQWEDWWGGPLYCTIGDQIYEAMLETGNASEMGCENFINEKFTDEMISIFKKEKIPLGMLVFDAGWMRNMALFDLHEERFPQFRSYMEKLRKQGIHSILWMAPYNTEFFMTGRCEFIYSNHQDWYVRNEENMALPLLDYTHPEVRAFMKSRIRYMLSDEEGCLNADGLKVDFYYHIPDPGMNFHDPSWGTGELMQYKVLKLIYDAAKEAKKEAFIECSSANPLFNDVQDACRLNDDVTDNIQTYEKRAWITIQSKCNVPDTDDWWSFKKYFVQLTLEKSIFGIPALYAIKYRGEQGHMLLGYSGVAPGGNPVNISREEYRRVSAILQVYVNCPVHIAHERKMDLERRVFSRIHTCGVMEGFYAAIGLNSNTALATFSETEGRVCSIMDSSVEVPVSKRMEEIDVFKVSDGVLQDRVQFESHGESIVFYAEDSGNRGSYYSISYKWRSEK